MSDNATPHLASNYRAEVKKTIPHHDELIDEAILVALAVIPRPTRWLDTGAGPGELVQRASHALPGTAFFVADPSEAMLREARAALPNLDAERFIHAPSAELPESAPFDVITAMQSHHYGDEVERERSVLRCFARLAKPGVLVVFENVRAESDVAQAWQRERWAAWQMRQGRTEEVARAHLAREGKAYFPIKPSQHLDLFRRVGFDGAELVHRTYAQAGFVAWKEA